MSQVQTLYEAHPLYGGLTWSFVREQISQDLREWYQVPKEVPPKMAALVRKLEAIETKSLRARTAIGTLDAIEGNQLRRHLGMPSEDEQMVEPRTIAGVKALPDWFLLT